MKLFIATRLEKAAPGDVEGVFLWAPDARQARAFLATHYGPEGPAHLVIDSQEWEIHEQRPPRSGGPKLIHEGFMA